ALGMLSLKTSFGTSWTLKDVREAEEAFLHNFKEGKETVELLGYKESPGYPNERCHICDSLYEAKSAIDSSSLTKLTHKSQVVSVDIPKNLAENDSIVPDHGLSSKITQNQGESLYISEGSENSGSFEDSRSSYEEYSKDEASCKEGGSKTPQVRRSTRESRAPVRYSPSANYLLMIENSKPESYSEALSSKESIQ
nr:putative retrovirus-related Pol polyprotein from transposon TNT 1-94 [Tanacetum cinerariifolium]